MKRLNSTKLPKHDLLTKRFVQDVATARRTASAPNSEAKAFEPFSNRW